VVVLDPPVTPPPPLTPFRLQVTNYGVLYVLFNSAPGGSNYIDVWDVCLHAQTPPNYFVANVFSDDPRREQAEKAVSTNRLPLFELAHVLVRLNQVASFIVNGNHSVM
jgi:hypothetical protein